jgi:phage shock protein C
MTDDKNSNDSFENNFFERMENAPPNIPPRKLVRSKNDVVITGVCAGIASYLKIESANIRLIAILSLLLGGWSLIIYLLLTVLIPQEKLLHGITDEELNDMRKENIKVIISGILMLIGFYYALQEIGLGNNVGLFMFPNSFMAPVAALFLGAYLIARKRFSGYTSYVLAAKDFSRSREQKLFMGVCGGLADYLGIDAGTIRIMFAIFSALTLGLFAVVYIIFALNTKYENVNSDE